VLWIRGETASELTGWRQRAGAIPDAPIRADALDALARKRDNVEGAALFAILPRRRHPGLVRLLVAYQTMWDFLDSASERGAQAGQANAQQLHLALVEALDPQSPLSDYYRYHPWKDDGGYLSALVRTCQSACQTLPCYRHVRDLVLDGVEGCAIQSLNHLPDAIARDAALRAWAEREHPGERVLSWFELAAAAGAFMPHVLLALAAEPACAERDVAAVHAAYFPWVALLISMLDSYVDREHDEAEASHSYLAHYPSDAAAIGRLSTIARQSVRQTGRLPGGTRHAVLTAGILAMYLSSVSADSEGLRAQTRTLAEAGGPLTRILLPVARGWRATRGRLPPSGVEAGRHPARARRMTPSTGRRAAVKRPSAIPARRHTARLPRGVPLPAAILTYLYWRWPFAYLERCEARYGKRFTHRMTSFPELVFLSDPSEVRQMMSAPADVLHPGEGGSVVAPIVGDWSFMLLDENPHLAGRRAMLPAFHQRVVLEEADRVHQIAQRTVTSWPRGVPLALHPRLRSLTLEVILRRVFGRGRDGSQELLQRLHERVLAMLSVTGSPVFPVPALRHGPGRSRWKRFLRDRARTDELLYALIEERCSCSDPSPQDALATLLAAHGAEDSQSSRMRLRDDVMSLILAGHETTASQLAWAFQLLAHNPATQQRLIEEIDRDAGDEYLTATIQEVLRHRPVFLFAIPRAVKRPIEIGGLTYRPPAQLLACIYLLHHDPRVYPEPDRFRPERFLEGQPSPREWMPWGGGRKRCPGAHMAILEMKTVLRTVLASAVVRPASRRMERPRWRSVIVTPHAGGRVVLRRRDRALRPPPSRHRAHDRQSPQTAIWKARI